MSTGIKIGNTFVKCDSPAEVAEAVRHLMPSRAPGAPAAYISPSRNGWIGVYEESLEGAVDLEPDLAAGLSEALGTVAISFHIWDGEYLRYALAWNGRLLDEFSQDPDSRGERPGRPAVLAQACGIPGAERSLKRLLRARNADSTETLTALSAELGICGAELSYRYLDHGETDGYLVLQRRELIGDRIPPAVEPLPGPAGPLRLPVEFVAMDAGHVGCVGLSGRLVAALGRRFLPMFAKDLVLRLHEHHGTGCQFTLWTDDVTANPAALWHVYVSAADAEERAAFIDELADDCRAPERQHTCPVPAGALPVARRTPDGTVIRLWPAPGPKVPAKQRVTIEGTTFTVLNRCFDLRNVP